MSTEELKGRYVTYVCRIDDPVAWQKNNPLHSNQVSGCSVVAVATGDLLAYADALDELIEEDREEEKQAAFSEHCYPGPRRVVPQPEDANLPLPLTPSA